MRLIVCLALLMGGSLIAAPIAALTFSPDGAVLVAAAKDQLLVCSPISGATDSANPCAGMRVSSVVFSADGALLAIGGGAPGEKGEVRLFAWRERQWRGSFSQHHDIVTSVAFDAAGTRLAVSCADHTARVFALEDQGRKLSPKLVLKGHSGPVQGVSFSPEGKLLVTVSLDRSVKVWSAANGELLRSFGQHTDAIHGLGFRPGNDGQATCATAGDDRTVRVWQPGIGRMVRIVRGHEMPILGLAYAVDGRSLFSVGAEGILRQIDADSDAVIRQWKVSDDWVYHVAVSPDGARVATGDWAGKVVVTVVR